jgi:hypothetical protein
MGRYALCFDVGRVDIKQTNSMAATTAAVVVEMTPWGCPRPRPRVLRHPLARVLHSKARLAISNAVV